MSQGGGGGSEKCQKSVTYYLNGPLCYAIRTQNSMPFIKSIKDVNE